MDDRGPALDAVQRWMQAVITHADGINAGIETSTAQDAVRIGPAEIEQLICRSKAQTSIERLSVYSNAYWARLLEVLTGEYPALVHALGEEVFIGLGNAYLQDHPPQSYTLADLGRHFPEYLALSRPPHQNDNDSPDWADFLIDLARLERMYSEIFDGPGIEGQATLPPEELSGLSAEDWLGTHLIPAPCLRLASFQFPVHEYASAVRRQRPAEIPDAQSTLLAITRRDFIVRRVALESDEFAVLSDLIAGKGIGEALERAFEKPSRPIDELAMDIRRWFCNWSAAGYFIGIQRR